MRNTSIDQTLKLDKFFFFTFCLFLYFIVFGIASNASYKEPLVQETVKYILLVKTPDEYIPLGVYYDLDSCNSQVKSIQDDSKDIAFCEPIEEE